jgi:hypothetical protein
MSARGPELPPDIIFDVDPALMQKAAYGDVKQLPPQNVKQSGPATEVEMLNKSENVKQLDDPDLKAQLELLECDLRSCRRRRYWQSRKPRYELMAR